MKIALIGYGKMGKTIEDLALQAGHEVVLKVGSQNLEDLTRRNLRQADVAIEFSRPESAFNNIVLCLEAGVPVVCGTTAWLDRLEEAKAICRNKKGALLYASNFSVGVNIFFAVNRHLAAIMHDQPQYDIKVEETHHTQKLDAPSGTAITLVEDILELMYRKNKWVREHSTEADEIPIVSKRIENVPGTHEVIYQSSIDSITIRHTAHSREGFAKGALVAAQWIIGKQGFFGMRDVLGF